MISYDLSAGTIEVGGYRNRSTSVLSCQVVLFVVKSDRSSFDLVVPVFFCWIVVAVLAAEESVRAVLGDGSKACWGKNSCNDFALICG
jgi:hypothetical protein